MRDATPIIDWLLSEARAAAGAEGLLDGLAPRLVAAGVPAWRITLHLPHLHPQLRGYLYEWRSDVGRATTTAIQRQVSQSVTYFHSPLGLLHRSRQPIRRRLVGPDAEVDFPVLEDLRNQGGTDYLLLPVPFSAGSVAGIGLTSRAESGFDEDAVALVRAVVPALGTVAEIHVERTIARGLLDTYVGHEAGQRILEGQITLGSSRSIHAVVLFSDLRGFTALSESLGRAPLLRLLNDFFACTVGPVREAGGEILKFLGDGLLAIFRLGEDGDESAICAKALRVAVQAVAELERVNAGRRERREPEARGGISLHIGTVLFGNIGFGDRLDFTVIGPAVNLASRLQTLCRDLDEPILASGEFARTCPAALRCVGRHALRGVGEPQEVFAPASS